METRPPGAEAEYNSGNASRLLLSDRSQTLQRQTKGRFWTIANSLALIYALGSIAFPIVLFAPVSGNIKGLYDKCDADGEFDYDADYIDPFYTYFYSKEIGYYYKSFVNLFSRPSIVTVTLAFGTYSFEQARWIDLAWDIGVGRIGQLLFIFAILNLLWAVSLWSLWLSTRGEYHIQTRYGAYRAAIDLVAVARATLGDKVEDMSNAEIEKELEKKKTGIVRSDEGTGKLINWDWTLFYKKSSHL
ncbi:hypothetical protein SLS54_010749 [Diplodia seriata]